MFPDIASGRTKFDYFERRIRKNLLLSKDYNNKKSKRSIK